MCFDEDVDNLHCGDCKYFGFDSPGHTPCQKRIDHKTVRFSVPWFKSYDCNQHIGVICSEFEPKSVYKSIFQTWRGFDYYWTRYVEQWNTPRYMSFILDGNKKIRYNVKTEDFVFGNLFVDGKLNAYERVYCVLDRKSPIGWRLVQEPWNPTESTQTK